MGADAEVATWEGIWDKYGNDLEILEYDILLVPHHCSWHSISHDSISDKESNAEVSTKAASALGQAREFAKLIASSKPIKDDDNDPPSFRAKLIYEAIAKRANGEFICVGEYPDSKKPLGLELNLKVAGITLATLLMGNSPNIDPNTMGNQPVGHG